jgi:hypothetical protein
MKENKDWLVFRCDDNGNTFVVDTELTLDEALSLVEEFEAKGHKQYYSVSLPELMEKK